MKKVFFLLFITSIYFSCNNKKENLSMPNRLIGVETHYVYSEGNEYKVKFEENGLSYQFKSGSKPEIWWGKFSYNWTLTKNNEHLVSWHEPKYGDYVTLLINFEKNLLYGSAIIKGTKVHFQTAVMIETKKP